MAPTITSVPACVSLVPPSPGTAVAVICPTPSARPAAANVPMSMRGFMCESSLVFVCVTCGAMATTTVGRKPASGGSVGQTTRGASLRFKSSPEYRPGKCDVSRFRHVVAHQGSFLRSAISPITMLLQLHTVRRRRPFCSGAPIKESPRPR